MKLLVAQSCPSLCNPWTIAHQAPQSMGFFRQEYWSGLPSLSPGDLLDPGIEPMSPALQADSVPSEPSEKPWGKRDAKISRKKGKKKFLGHWNIFRIISKYFSDCGDTFSLLFRKLPFFFFFSAAQIVGSELPIALAVEAWNPNSTGPPGNS